MASARYTLNIEHEEPQAPKVYTKKEKFENFWHYHKFIILGALAVIFFAIAMIYEMLNVVEPDYQIAMLNDVAVPEQAVQALTLELEKMADDLNGDGIVDVVINQYTFTDTATPTSDAQSQTSEDAIQMGSTETDLYTQMASITRLSADIQTGQSIIYFTNDVEQFDMQFSVFANNDGTTPSGQDKHYSEMGFSFNDSTMLSAIDAQWLNFANEMESLQTTFEDYKLYLRIYNDTTIENDEDLQDYYNASVSYFNKITS